MNRLEDLKNGNEHPGLETGWSSGKISGLRPWGLNALHAFCENREVTSPVKKGSNADFRDGCMPESGAKLFEIHCTADQDSLNAEADGAVKLEVMHLLASDFAGWPKSHLAANEYMPGSLDISTPVQKDADVSTSPTKLCHSESSLSSQCNGNEKFPTLHAPFVRVRRKGKAHRAGKQALVPASFGVRSLPREIELRVDEDFATGTNDMPLAVHEVLDTSCT